MPSPADADRCRHVDAHTGRQDGCIDHFRDNPTFPDVIQKRYGHNRFRAKTKSYRSFGEVDRKLAERTGGHTPFHCSVENRCDAEEFGGPLVDRIAPQAGRRVGLHDPALAHHRHPVGHQRGLGVIVGHDHRRRGRLAHDRSDVDREPVAQKFVERGERFVEQQQPWPRRQGIARDALGLSAGDLPYRALPVTGQADQLQHLLHPCLDVAASPARIFSP